MEKDTTKKHRRATSGILLRKNVTTFIDDCIDCPGRCSESVESDSTIEGVIREFDAEIFLFDFWKSMKEEKSSDKRDGIIVEYTMKLELALSAQKEEINTENRNILILELAKLREEKPIVASPENNELYMYTLAQFNRIAGVNSTIDRINIFIYSLLTTPKSSITSNKEKK